MPTLKVYSSALWKPPVAMSCYNIGIGYKPVKRISRAANGHIDIPTSTWVNDWILVADYTFPTTESVPGVVINKAPATQITYGVDVSWTVITDVNDSRYGWNVVVVFHDQTTSTDYVTNQPQTAGTVRSPALPQFDLVNADVFYSFNSHDGPHTVTATKTLGP